MVLLIYVIRFALWPWYIYPKNTKTLKMNTVYLRKFVIGTLLLIAIAGFVNFIIYLVQFLNG